MNGFDVDDAITNEMEKFVTEDGICGTVKEENSALLSSTPVVETSMSKLLYIRDWGIDENPIFDVFVVSVGMTLYKTKHSYR